MDAAQYREALRILVLTNTTAAAWLGVTPRSCQMWASGSPIPGPVARALRLACGVRGADRWALIDDGMEPVENGFWVAYRDLAPLLAMEG